MKFTELEVPPPTGLNTITAEVPVEVMLAAGIAAVSCVELTNVVAGDEPPKLTVESATKLVPLMVSVKFPPPATALFGEIEVIVGADGGGGLLTDWLEPPPHPDAAMSAKIRSATIRE